MDFSNMTKLRKFYASNCTGLTGTIDLSECIDIREVDVSGTTTSVTIPSGSKITKYELGTPTDISIVNPTVLQPSGVLVDDSSNISSLELINIPGNKTFAMFNKIMS
jgi:hypothetical protein